MSIENLKNLNVKEFKMTKHDFHIVDRSPWPFCVSWSAFFMLFGLTLYLHAFEVGFSLMSIGFISTVFSTSLWWRDVIREGTFQGKHTARVRTGLRLGVILFIVSEVMLFFGFFWAFFHSALNPVFNIGGVWPPKGIETLSPWGIPLLNTAILLTSGAALTWSHAALIAKNRLEAIAGLIWTIILAAIFTLWQGFEYTHAPFNISDGIYGSCFYMLTGLHGFHVIVGTCFLTVALVRLVLHHFTNTVHIGYESAAWYWHFVDVVWIFLYVTVYVWGA